MDQYQRRGIGLIRTRERRLVRFSSKTFDFSIQLSLFLFRFDPWALLNGFRNKAIDMGVEFVRGEAVGFEAEEVSGMNYQAGIGQSMQKLKRIQVSLSISFNSFNSNDRVYI